MLWGGQAARAARLLPGLLQTPDSRFRAVWLKENPPDDDGSAQFGFLGWSQDSAILASIYNVVAALAGSESVLESPAAPRRERLFAPTIAEFNVDRFMALPGAVR